MLCNECPLEKLSSIIVSSNLSFTLAWKMHRHYRTTIYLLAITFLVLLPQDIFEHLGGHFYAEKPPSCRSSDCIQVFQLYLEQKTILVGYQSMMHDLVYYMNSNSLWIPTSWLSHFYSIFFLSLCSYRSNCMKLW